MKQSNKNKLIEGIKSIWLVKIILNITKYRTLCSSCHKNPKDKEYPGSICFHCYYTSLIQQSKGGNHR